MSPVRASWKSRGAPGLSSRRPEPDGREANGVRLRLDWEALAGKVKAACALSAAGDDAETWLELKHLVARTGRAPPPFEAEPVRTIAAGFRLMVEALTHSHPERRAAMADVMIAGARLVDDLLTEERTRSALGWQRQFGGD